MDVWPFSAFLDSIAVSYAFVSFRSFDFSAYGITFKLVNAENNQSFLMESFIRLAIKRIEIGKKTKETETKSFENKHTFEPAQFAGNVRRR